MILKTWDLALRIAGSVEEVGGLHVAEETRRRSTGSGHSLTIGTERINAPVASIGMASSPLRVQHVHDGDRGLHDGDSKSETQINILKANTLHLNTNVSPLCNKLLHKMKVIFISNENDV
jgi:hypothetical protein